MEKSEEKKVLTGVKEKFANVRKTCKGMNDDMYVLTDYISYVARDLLEPIELLVVMIGIIDDIDNEQNGFKPNGKFPEILKSRGKQVCNQIMYIPQVVDVIASEEFSEEFRDLCFQILNINPPKLVNQKTKSEYPDYVKIAVDWWAIAIQNPSFDNGLSYDNGQDMNPLLRLASLGKTRSYTEAEINKFKENLSRIIDDKIEKYGQWQLDVDYDPCKELDQACKESGLTNVTFPWKTHMYISDTVVEVVEGYGSEVEQLWPKRRKEKKKVK